MSDPSSPTPQDASKAIGGLISLGVLVYLAYMFFGGGLQKETNKTMGDIHQKVVSDSVSQYNITKQSGTPVDQCVHAGLVAASYLQAQDQANYAKWKQIESADCEVAGVPR